MTAIPTISELYNSIISDLETEFGSNINPIGKTFLRAYAAVHASMLKILYLALSSVQKNLYVDTCDYETLLRYGQLKLGRSPFAATAGVYMAQVQGQIGATILANTTFKSNDNALNSGVMFVIDEDYTLVSTTDTISIRCLIAGTQGKLEVGNILNSTSPIANVQKQITIISEVEQPLDVESENDYRASVIQSYRLEPQGGAASDYRIWASDVQGVRTVYAYNRTNYVSWVNLFIEATEQDSIDGKGTPSSQMILDVEDVVNQSPDDSLPILERGRRPVQVFVNYLPVTINEITITIDNYLNLDASKQNLIFHGLNSMIKNIRPFIAASDNLLEKNDTIDLNKIISSIITSVAGSSFGTVTFTVNATPYNTYTFDNGNIPHLQTVSYT